MSKHLLLAMLWILLSACGTNKDAGFLTEKEENLLEDRLEEAAVRYRMIIEEFRGEEKIPYTLSDMNVSGVDPSSWTSGFFPGSLWYLYEYTGEDYWKEQAVDYTSRLEEQQFNTGTHDLGFMMYCSYGNAYRLTGNPEYKEILLKSAESLSSRYSARAGVIRSWDFPGWWKEYPVIVDNMMNLELLFWASEASDDPVFEEIAIEHSIHTMEEHYRDDYSCYHVVDYDTISGEALGKGTLQGFSDSSSWARGQAWGIYGFALVSRETGNKRFLEHDEKIADYLLSQMDEDPVPCWDYDVAGLPGEEKDASAGAILASSFIELYTLTGDEKYMNASKELLLKLSGPEYFASEGENGGFLLKHCVAHKPAGVGVDTPLSYADYYYLEAILKLLEIENDEES